MTVDIQPTTNGKHYKLIIDQLNQGPVSKTHVTLDYTNKVTSLFISMDAVLGRLELNFYFSKQEPDRFYIG